ncbi:hypothetical protein [Noviherbaspirillum aerium]|uniref:hypothetical protein n=1 Tax=Noviherbaspirillum aerium TaxID=2588497 RepID=UPI00124D1A6A|nr:hypothetical protein [Noviherbaspirillum aerium]
MRTISAAAASALIHAVIRTSPRWRFSSSDLRRRSAGDIAVTAMGLRGIANELSYWVAVCAWCFYHAASIVAFIFFLSHLASFKRIEIAYAVSKFLTVSGTSRRAATGDNRPEMKISLSFIAKNVAEPMVFSGYFPKNLSNQTLTLVPAATLDFHLPPCCDHFKNTLMQWLTSFRGRYGKQVSD